MKKYLISMVALAILSFAADAPNTSRLPDSQATPMSVELDNGISPIFYSHGTTRIGALTEEQWAKESGKAIITREECEEVVNALNESRNAHIAALGFYVQALESFGKNATREELKVMMDNAAKCRDGANRVQSILPKWRVRLESLKETKP